MKKVEIDLMPNGILLDWGMCNQSTTYSREWAFERNHFLHFSFASSLQQQLQEFYVTPSLNDPSLEYLLLGKTF